MHNGFHVGQNFECFYGCVCVCGGGGVRVQGTCHIVHIVQLTLCIDFLGKK